MEKPRKKIISVRVSTAEEKILKAKAKARSVEVSTYLRLSGLGVVQS